MSGSAPLEHPFHPTEKQLADKPNVAGGVVTSGSMALYLMGVNIEQDRKMDETTKRNMTGTQVKQEISDKATSPVSTAATVEFSVPVERKTFKKESS
jgi:hypothetical protein